MMSDTDVEVLGPVNYLVVEFPADKANFTGEIAAELTSLVDRQLVRVLDLVILTKDLDGSVEAVELSEVDESNVGQLLALEAGLAMLLAEEDVEAVGKALEPGSVAAVLVYENSWAGPFASAVRRAGGQLVANGRIPTQALLAAIDTDGRSLRCRLGRGRAGRPGVIGGPVTRTAAVVGTAAVVKHGHDRREDHRDDRGDRREDRREDRGPGIR